MERVGAIGRFFVLAFFGSILCLILIVIKVNFVTYKVHRDSIDLGLNACTPISDDTHSKSRPRERDTDRIECMFLHTHTHTHTYTFIRYSVNPVLTRFVLSPESLRAGTLAY